MPRKGRRSLLAFGAVRDTAPSRNCETREGQIFQRGQRFGMIKLGSTTELYLPENCKPKPVVQPGQHVRAGQSIVAYVTGNPIQPTAVPADTGPEKT